MSQNSITPNLMQQLSIGNTISLGLNLYRSHLKQYFKLSLFAHLWLLVPIYGWAKSCAISGLISRLVFNELVEQPEPIGSVRSKVQLRMWHFLLLSLLVTLLLILVVFLSFIGVFLGTVLALVPIILIKPTIYTFLNQESNQVWIGLFVILVWLALGGFIIVWAYSRFFIAEVPLAVEVKQNSWAALRRSCKLTKRSIFRIQGIILIASAIVFPVFIVGQIIDGTLSAIFATFIPTDSTIYSAIGIFCSIAITLLTNTLTMPFWQAIKAVIYYDNRCRQESLDLHLSDRSLDGA